METIEDFGEELEVEVTSPVQHHIFYVNEDAGLLDEKKKDFLQCGSKKIKIVKRGSRDLETLVSFLTMRVTKINVDDWKQLKISLV